MLSAALENGKILHLDSNHGTESTSLNESDGVSAVAVTQYRVYHYSITHHSVMAVMLTWQSTMHA